MTFTSNLAQKQARIATARRHYQDCADKLNKVIEQLVIADPWDTKGIAELNKALGVAEYQEQGAWRAWDAAISEINHLPDEPAKVAKSYLESKGYQNQGDRCIWEPRDPSDLDDAFQHNDEPDLHFDQLADLMVGSEEITYEFADGRVYIQYADTEF